MKLLWVIGLFFVFDACLASPAQHRWTLVPDSDGRMHLMDLNPVDADMVEIEPMFTPETDTAFLLFTRNNRNAAQRLTRDANAIRASNFNANWPVRLLIHGFNSGPSSGVNTATTTSYLNRGDFNVIVVDWSIGAATINYVTARNRVPQVGTVIASFLDFLVQNGFTNLNRVFIAGHSLGAHIAGITGKRVTSGRIQAIFGLDPAGPLFSIGAPNDRFAPGDAVYTEGIVTNGGNLGFDQPIATANFYPNWGTSQPGCGLDVAGSCAHSRAHEFFAESVATNRFVARRCSNYQEIVNRSCTGATNAARMGGEPGNHGQNGIFFLTTNANSPFAQG